jgi:P-type Cu+ transporter
MGLDPVCKMEVNPASAEAQSEYQGQTFYFCSVECMRKFDANPQQYIDESARQGAPRPAGAEEIAHNPPHSCGSHRTGR